MTLKQKIAGEELYFFRAYNSFWWSQENGWRFYNCHIKNYHVGLFRNAKGSKETWVLPHTNQTQYQKWMSQKLIFFFNDLVCTLPKHMASINLLKKPLEHAFAPHFASNYCSCWAPWAVSRLVNLVSGISVLLPRPLLERVGEGVLISGNRETGMFGLPHSVGGLKTVLYLRLFAKCRKLFMDLIDLAVCPPPCGGAWRAG